MDIESRDDEKLCGSIILMSKKNDINTNITRANIKFVVYVFNGFRGVLLCWIQKWHWCCSIRSTFAT